MEDDSGTTVVYILLLCLKEGGCSSEEIEYAVFINSKIMELLQGFYKKKRYSDGRCSFLKHLFSLQYKSWSQVDLSKFRRDACFEFFVVLRFKS